jgi:cold-inducible RNA-binding protein
VDIYFPADRITGRPRGFAFVTFATDAEAEEAIRRFHDREVDGRKLVVNPAEARPPRGADGGGSYVPAAGRFGADRPPRPTKRKGSRRGLRGRKRSL